jgi:cyclopropane fatty-acyl-phospholipid synthase-like methyltransferase
MMGFEHAYTGTPPWDIGRPQPAFAELAQRGDLQGHVLDAGCGTGEHALLAASIGLQAIGVDGAPTAIRKAQEKARDRGLEARFVVADVRALDTLGERFDSVLDSGCFHTFDDDDRSTYVASLAAVVVPGGRYFLLCFSDRQPGVFGPRRVSQTEIHDAFADGWSVDAIDPAGMDTTGDRTVLAWRAAITRV